MKSYAATCRFIHRETHYAVGAVLNLEDAEAALLLQRGYIVQQPAVVPSAAKKTKTEKPTSKV